MQWKGSVSEVGLVESTFALSQPPYNSGPPSSREQLGEGVACVEVWVSQWWAVAAGSWALTTYILQLQPELWRLGNGSRANYNDWLPVCWHFSDGDCRVEDTRGRRRAVSHWLSSFLLLHENSQRLKSDWLHRKEMFHDLVRQSWREARDRWCCTDGGLVAHPTILIYLYIWKKKKHLKTASYNVQLKS